LILTRREAVQYAGSSLAITSSLFSFQGAETTQHWRNKGTIKESEAQKT